MRVFWAIVGLLAIITVALMWRGSGGSKASDSPNLLAAGASSSPTESAPAPATSAQAQSSANSAAAAASEEDAEVAALDENFAELEEALALADELYESATQSTATPPAGTGNTEQSATAIQPGDHTAHVPGTPAQNPLAPGANIASDAPRQPVAAGPATLEPQPDGSVLVDGKYVVRGSGTKEDPYQINWDLLVSASDTYQPRLGMTELPERIKMLDGKHIKIAGYLAFPLATMEAKEVLVMLNMWDGCCIGVPPSPYDAIEVKLKKPMAMTNQRFLNYGTLKGTLRVDPYLANDWLLGLYLVDDGELEYGL